MLPRTSFLWKPESTLRRDDLPLPLGPTIADNFDDSNFPLTFFRISLRPNKGIWVNLALNLLLKLFFYARPRTKLPLTLYDNWVNSMLIALLMIYFVSCTFIELFTRVISDWMENLNWELILQQQRVLASRETYSNNFWCTDTQRYVMIIITMYEL